MSTGTPIAKAFVPLRIPEASLAMRGLVVVLGTLVLAASSQIQVPLYPVPMTMQTYALLLIGALCGWRLAAITVIAYLAEAAAGLPFLAGGAAGPLNFVGPTAGYLMAFPIGAALVGWLAERGWTTRSRLHSLVALTAGHVVILAGGVAWLSQSLGLEAAVKFGLAPFLLATVLKTALAQASVEAFRRLRRNPA